MTKRNPPKRLAYDVADTLLTGVFPNKNSLYRAIARGDLRTWKEGRRRMVSAESLHRYVESKAA